ALKRTDIEDPAVKNVYNVTSRAGQDIFLKGYQKDQTLGSYLHVHFGSNPGCAKSFVENCANFRETRLNSIKTDPMEHGNKEHHGCKRA
ncbi:MAG: hypothetical protein GY860_09900, partial [Desulfobacteraceae bacterium]|nr:hypothetical protein [Desulfobacteraceae bacterium]